MYCASKVEWPLVRHNRGSKTKGCAEKEVTLRVAGGQKGLEVVTESKLQYRVIHKSVKHLKNPQQIDYSTDHGISYADRERNAPSFLCTYFTHAQYIHLW